MRSHLDNAGLGLELKPFMFARPSGMLRKVHAEGEARIHFVEKLAKYEWTELSQLCGD